MSSSGSEKMDGMGKKNGRNEKTSFCFVFFIIFFFVSK